MDQFSHCPRCESRTLEHLQTYSHCIDCFYFEDRHYDGEKAYFQACASELLFKKLIEDTPKDLDEIEPDLAS